MAMAWLLFPSTDALAQVPTLTTTPLPGVIQNGNVTAFFGATGQWNIDGQGPTDRVTLEIKQTDADGTSNEIFYAEVLCTGNNPPATGTYNGGRVVSYTAGKNYYIKTRLYNSTGSVVPTDWRRVVPN